MNLRCYIQPNPYPKAKAKQHPAAPRLGRSEGSVGGPWKGTSGRRTQHGGRPQPWGTPEGVPTASARDQHLCHPRRDPQTGQGAVRGPGLGAPHVPWGPRRLWVRETSAKRREDGGQGQQQTDARLPKAEPEGNRDQRKCRRGARPPRTEVAPRGVTSRGAHRWTWPRKADSRAEGPWCRLQEEQ